MLGIKQKFGCVHHPWSHGAVKSANGTLKGKLVKIIAGSNNKLNLVEVFPLALMSMRTQNNRINNTTYNVHRVTNAGVVL